MNDEIVEKDISKENENYELTDNKVVLPDKDSGKFRVLRQIRAIKDIKDNIFGEVIARKGTLGGFIESKGNLNSEPGAPAWIERDVLVYGDTKIINGIVRRSVLNGNITIDGSSLIVGVNVECNKGYIDIKGSMIDGENGSIKIESTGGLTIEDVRISNHGESTLKIIGDGVIKGKHNFEGVKSEKSSVNELKESERT